MQLDVKGRVQLEVPEDWTVHDAQFRKRVAEMREKLTGEPKHSETLLIVQSFPTPSKVWLRVSFVPSDPPLTQAELREVVRTDRQQLLRELADAWREGAPTMRALLGKQGMREVGRPSFAVEHLGGQLAFINRYARTIPEDFTGAMKVEMHHVPLGGEKALITISHIAGDREAERAVARLKSSMVIR